MSYNQVFEHLKKISLIANNMRNQSTNVLVIKLASDVNNKIPSDISNLNKKQLTQCLSDIQFSIKRMRDSIFSLDLQDPIPITCDGEEHAFRYRPFGLACLSGKMKESLRKAIDVVEHISDKNSP